MSSETKSQDLSHLSIVVGLGFTDADGIAFDQAVSVASGAAHSEIHLVHVFDAAKPEKEARELVEHLRLYVNEKVAARGGIGPVTVGIHLRAGDPVAELSRFAGEVHANLIVLGSHKGPHLKSWLVGSTAEHLIASAPCPVLVAAPKPRATAKAGVPAIEPPCPDCARVRATTKGAEWWCERHAHHAKQAHTFSYQREIPFSSHDSEVIPTGIEF